jgi:PTH2 family peptidyl-tRNA hydrolase
MKQVIVVRKDLHMDVGKLVSQACHACLEASEESKKRDLKAWKTWRREGAKKVVVKVDSVEDLLTLEKKAGRLDIPKALIVDRHTESVNCRQRFDADSTEYANGLRHWAWKSIDHRRGYW